MAYVVSPPATVGVPVNGTGDLFPVRRIFCVGRNYAAHAREMGHDPDREPPFFFMKPPDAIVPNGARHSSDLSNVSLPTPSYTTGTPLPPVISFTRAAKSSVL